MAIAQLRGQYQVQTAGTLAVVWSCLKTTTDMRCLIVGRHLYTHLRNLIVRCFYFIPRDPFLQLNAI